MKIGTVLVSAMLCAIVVGNSDVYAGDLGNAAQSLKALSSTQIAHAKKSYLAALQSSNDGVVETAIGIVLQWHLLNPGEDLSQCERKINDLALNGKSSAIRFKASLASLVIDNPSIANFDVATCKDCGDLFDAITGSVRQAVVGNRLQ
jgi:hypothetical protein